MLLTSLRSSFVQSLIALPRVGFDKIKKFWIGKVCLVNDLFYYLYPFGLPNFFNTKLTKDEFEVRFKFIQVFNSINIEKVFRIQEFLDLYLSVISNQRKSNISKYYIQLVQELKNNDLIEPDFKIISDGSFILADKLTLSNISGRFIIRKNFYFEFSQIKIV